MRIRSAAMWLLPFAGVALAPPQKSESGVVRETASATVIEVPVNVLNKDGRPAAGLTASDFELFDNGKKQVISGFEVADLSRKANVPGAANPFAEPPPAVARRHWLLVFDLSYSSPTGLVRARDGARQFVEKDLAPDDLAGVSTLSVEHGWKLIENFTDDRVQLARAIDTLGVVKTGIRTNDPLAFAFELPGASQTASPALASNSEVLREYVADLQRMQLSASDQRERGRISQQMESLASMARLLDSVRGRKHVLLFSEGFESRMLSGNAGQFATPMGESSPAQDSAAEASVHGQNWKIDSDTRFGSSETRGVLADALSVFRRSDVVLDTIDISGLRADGDVARRAGSGTEALFAMANATEGDFIRNANQLSTDLEQIVQRSDLVYVLSFQPTHLIKPGAFHELKVKVDVPVSRLSCRSGYYEPRPYGNLTPIERVLASGDLLTGGAAGELSMHMLAAAFPSDARVAQVPVILEIPGKPLIEGDPGPTSGVPIYIYASDANGTLTDFLTQEMHLDLKRLRPRLEAGGIKFYGTLFLPPGQYRVRALVRNASTGHSALSTAAVTVPAMPGNSPAVLSPFFQEPVGSWLMVKASPRAEASAHPADYPFAMDGNSFIPTAHPVIARGAAAQVAVLAYNMFDSGSRGGAGGVEPLQVVSEVVGSDGKERPARVEVLRRCDRERSGGRALLLSLASVDLEPGRYVLRVRVSDRQTRRTAEGSSLFEVRSP